MPRGIKRHYIIAIVDFTDGWKFLTGWRSWERSQGPAGYRFQWTNDAKDTRVFSSKKLAQEVMDIAKGQLDVSKDAQLIPLERVG